MPEIIDYIKTQQRTGFSSEQIQQALVAAGWQPNDIQAAFNAATAVTVSPVKHRKTKWIILGIIIGLMLLAGLAIVVVPLFFITTTAIQHEEVKDQTSQHIADIKVIQNAVELYRSGHQNTYPTVLSSVDASYIFNSHKTMPIDPASQQPYYYQVTSDGKNYTVCPPNDLASPTCVTTQYK